MDSRRLTLTTEGEKLFTALAEKSPFTITTGFGRGVKLAGGQKGAVANFKGGQAPAMVYKRHGKGIAVFLNFSLPKDSPIIRSLVRDCLRLARIQPMVKVCFPGQPRKGTFGVFTYRQALYYGLVVKGEGGWLKKEKPVSFSLRFPRRQYLYAAREGRLLGQTDNYRGTTVPDRAVIFASLPYKLENITVKTSLATYAPGDSITVTATAVTDGKQPEIQAWQLRVMAPGGKEQSAYSQVRIVKNARLTWQLPLALNAPSGTWSIRCRDAITGITGKTTFQVK